MTREFRKEADNQWVIIDDGETEAVVTLNGVHLEIKELNEEYEDGEVVMFDDEVAGDNIDVVRMRLNNLLLYYKAEDGRKVYEEIMAEVRSKVAGHTDYLPSHKW